MPAEDAGRAKDEEVWNLIVYIRSLGKNVPAAATRRCACAADRRNSRAAAATDDVAWQPAFLWQRMDDRRSPCLRTKVARVPRKQPKVPFQVLGGVLELAVHRLVRLLHDLCPRCLCP